GLVAWERGHDHPVGYAQVSRGTQQSWAIETVVDPHHRRPGNTIGLDLVRAALGVIAESGGGHVHLWVSKPRPEHDHLAAELGLSPGRVLYQMRRSLPLPDDLAGSEPLLPTRPFRRGEDEKAWLEVNNRAFAWHPEQGSWDLDTLERREAEPWFDPAGLLLYEERGAVVGFLWTKVHPQEHPPLGELYVLAVDPSAAGHGLGRRLMVAGLAYLTARGLHEAMLYVDASNARAVKLYIDLGFVVNHIDRAYTGDVEAAAAP
ncbi:MAG: mycothiol synthase, partial [Acidimicrobiales bacterium]